MKREIQGINLILPDDSGDKSLTIQRWIQMILRSMDYHKDCHQKLLKEATHLIELACWKMKLSDNEEDDDVPARNELRLTSGANIVIKNVLPFLSLA